jgi:hypothetical protein
LIDWFLQLIQHKNLGLISVNLGQLLCGNPTLNFGLSVVCLSLPPSEVSFWNGDE